MSKYKATTHDSRVRYLHRGIDARPTALSTKRARFHEVNALLASQSVPLNITFPVLSHEIIVRSLWLGAAQPTTDLSNTLLHSQPRQLLDNNVPRLPRQVPTNCSIRSGEISGDTVAGGDDLGFLVPLQTLQLSISPVRDEQSCGAIAGVYSSPEPCLMTPNAAWDRK